MGHRISQKSQNEHGNILTDAGVLNCSKKKKKKKKKQVDNKYGK